jgi:hypothetical protein
MPTELDTFTIFILVLLAGYLFLYISGKYYLRQGFEGGNSLKKEMKECKGTIVEFEEPAEKPYLNRPINDVDDYEYNIVFYCTKKLEHYIHEREIIFKSLFLNISFLYI